MDIHKTYDVIVVGGGHAGTEAALAAARMGCDTLLLTQSIDTIGQMSCNPAIGGIGKSHLVREIDALGGAMAYAADQAGIQFRVLNRRKGPAVRATRAQADRMLYKAAIREMVERQPGLSVFQQTVEDLLVQGGSVTGVVCQLGVALRARTVVLTVGTFLGGRIHIGSEQRAGGRAGDPPANALAQRLRALPFSVGRLKTGTPPRIDGRSINYGDMSEQPGDTPRPVFSFLGDPAGHPPQVSCHVTQTTGQTHEIIRANLHLSAMYSGGIEGVGPRYCPSIEDKVVRFADKSSHQIFVEPEGLNTSEVYPNGISTSLPFPVQVDFVRSIRGFENAEITRPGYAIEYDYFDPRELNGSLETLHLQNLFFAGQINGTTGYEEAGAQGILAGINAALRVRDEALWVPRRDEAYIGVLVDDLVTNGTIEPYRMFTSRAEHRLWLRQDNADLRLTETGRAFGLVDDRRWAAFEAKREAVEAERQRLRSTWIRPTGMPSQQQDRLNGLSINREHRLEELLRRPDVDYQILLALCPPEEGIPDELVAEQVEIQVKYEGYIARQRAEIEKYHRSGDVQLPAELDYEKITGLSNEARAKLSQIRPADIGQAARISGITPAAVSLLLVHLKKHHRVSNTTAASPVVQRAG